ncbi:hypothetical protein [Aeromonas media]|uniref:hypothetical protein n=1 Tax=Aeromonas media TaxID=651 RepID=UPI001117F4B0|nr:hypothetical protein [Aeromonas media]
MTRVISNPTVIIKRGTLTPAIEIDLDRIAGLHANGGWNQLIQSFTAKWIKQHSVTGSATIWNFDTFSTSFGHPGYSVFIAQFGLPDSYLEALLDYLSEELGTSVRLSDFVQPSLREGWEPRIHIQNNEAWQQEDETEWSKINI